MASRANWDFMFNHMNSCLYSGIFVCKVQGVWVEDDVIDLAGRPVPVHVLSWLGQGVGDRPAQARLTILRGKKSAFLIVYEFQGQF